MVEIDAPGDAAGGVAAELFVVVVAHAELQVVLSEASLVLGEAGVVATPGLGELGVAVDPVAQPVEAEREQLALADAEIALQRSAVAIAAERAHEHAVGIVVRGVGVASGVELQVDAVVRLPAQLAADHLLGGSRVVEEAVVMVVRHCAQPLDFGIELLTQRVATAQRQRVVLVAVEIGFFGETAGEDREAGAAAGIDAIAGLVRVVGAEPATLAATAKAGAEFAQLMAAGADAQVRGVTGPVATGEDLDHAADGFGAIQAGTRTTHDLDALDQFDRQVLQRGQARGGRADAHAVDQEQHVVRVGTAQEHRRLLAESALVGQVDAGAAAQQLGQGTRLAALDLRAVDHFDRGQRVIDGDRGAGTGDHDLVEFGGGVRVLREGKRWQRQCDCSDEGSTKQH